MIAYILKSIACLSVLYVPYVLLLRKESFFRFNRGMLLFILLLSLLLPLMNLPWLAWNVKPEMPDASMEMGQDLLFGTELTASESTRRSIDVWKIGSVMYMIGVALLLSIKAIQFILLYRRIHKGVLFTDTQKNVTIYIHVENIASFSWFKRIVINRNDYEKHYDEIILHEMGHVFYGHSWDVLLLNLLQVLQWPNPFVWLLGVSLRDVHEYEADDFVLKEGILPEKYQLLLVRKAIGNSTYAFSNGFNHSHLSKRIRIMLQKKSNPWLRAKALYAVPAAIVLLSAFATPKNGSDDGNIRIEEATTYNIDADSVLLLVDGKETTQSEIAEIPSETIDNVSVIKDKDAIRSYTAKHVEALILVTTKAKAVSKEEHQAKEEQTKQEAVVLADEMPEFPGGKDKLLAFITKNMRYPELALKLKMRGRIVVGYVIDKEGNVCNAEVVKSTCSVMPVKQADGTEKDIKDVLMLSQQEYDRQRMEAKTALEEEALRVVNSMPKWKPGMIKAEDGVTKKPVAVKYTIPMVFRLQ